MEFKGNRIIVTPGGSISYQHLGEIKYVLENGGIVILPSDTCYTLASLPFNIDSLGRIANIEPHSIKNEIPLSFSGRKMLEKYCTPNEKEMRAIDKFCPGPLTLVCKMKKEMIDKKLNLLIHTDKTIGVRIPDSVIERQISEYLNSPITTCALRDYEGKIIQNYDNVVSTVRDRIKNVIHKYTILAIEVPYFIYKENSSVISFQPNIDGAYEIKVFREGMIDVKKIKREASKFTWSDIKKFDRK
ncbi:MAG: hypothetical protein EVB11_08950 [Winogradskyella sp.]|nr:MAG: hypothetical protein EVB11_08950 [Winogradskyella sp.]